MSCRVDLAKAPRHHRCSRQHRELVDGYRSAVAAQETRAEAHSHGYGTELEEFYRDVERRVVFKDWLLGTSRASEREAAGDGQ